MSENIQTIFNMLGVKPNQRFKVKCDYEIYNDYYYIDENLKFQIDKKDCVTSLTTLDAIRGDIEIIHSIVLSEKEQKIINSLFELGFHYIARDNDRGYTLYAYKTLPEQDYFYSWTSNDMGYVKIEEIEDNLFDFIKIKDNKPFFIDEYVKNNKEYKKYETDEKKIKEKMVGIYSQAKKKCDNLNCNECDYVNYISCNEKMFIDELIANNFTFLKESSINNSEFPIEKFQDPEGSTLRK